MGPYETWQNFDECLMKLSSCNTNEFIDSAAKEFLDSFKTSLDTVLDVTTSLGMTAHKSTYKVAPPLNLAVVPPTVILA